MASIRRILVANRGEIARRVFRTARDMGIETVAVFSDVDADAPFVSEADVAVPLGGRTSAESYLDGAKILTAARRAGADAVHPGYGFLSENPEFAEAVLEAGLTWIGPAPEQIRAMALKVESKEIAERAGLPLIPGAPLDPRAGASELLEVGQRVGFPLLIKASAGGGGKGMRIVRSPETLLDDVASARREAASAFGNDTVFLERLVERSRHVEVQVFGDTRGNLVHLFERECSIQRRHQKIVEEAPSPGADEGMLAKMYEAALAVARAISYVGAGTVEFLVSGEGAEQEFFFLEMNTRLQVEHAVTEEITGLDLVEWQIRVARGEELPLAQGDIAASGHAIEVRLYAEDPARGYLPSTGRVAHLKAMTGPDVRLESGIETGSHVTPFYDPMLAKVITTGEDRAASVARLSQFLRTLEIGGLTTNRDSLAAIVAHTSFAAGDTTTDFLDEHPEVLSPVVQQGVRSVHLTAAAIGLLELDRAAESAESGRRPIAPAGWSNVPMPAHLQPLRFSEGGIDLDVEVLLHRRRDGWGVGLQRNGQSPWPGTTGAIEISEVTCVPAGVVTAAGPDSAVTLAITAAGVRSQYVVRRAGEDIIVTGPEGTTGYRALPRLPEPQAGAAQRGPSAPVPGTVTVVCVEVGQRVEAGESLVVLEAMKMEHRIAADVDGVVTEVLVSVGDSVEAHALLVVVEAKS